MKWTIILGLCIVFIFTPLRVYAADINLNQLQTQPGLLPGTSMQSAPTIPVNKVSDQSKSNFIVSQLISWLLKTLQQSATPENISSLSGKVKQTGVINKTQTIGQSKVQEIAQDASSEAASYQSRLKQVLGSSNLSSIRLASFIFQGNGLYTSYIESLRKKNESLLNTPQQNKNLPSSKKELSLITKIKQSFTKLISSEYRSDQR